MSTNRAQNREQRRREVEAALRESTGLILKTGPFSSLRTINAQMVKMILDHSRKIMNKVEDSSTPDLDLLSKGHRVFFTCPMKLTRPLVNRHLDAARNASRVTPGGSLPTGSTALYTHAIFDINPTFERINDGTLDSRFAALDAALVRRLLEDMSAEYISAEDIDEEDEMSDWPLKVTSSYDRDDIQTFPSTVPENEVQRSFDKYIITPVEALFKAVNFDVKFSPTATINSIIPDYLVYLTENQDTEQDIRNPGPANVRQLNPGQDDGNSNPHALYSFPYSEKETLLTVEFKKRGLLRFIKDGTLDRADSNFRSILKEVLGYMIAYSTDISILSDFETTILMELSFPVEHNQHQTEKKKDTAPGENRPITRSLQKEWEVERHAQRQDKAANAVKVPLKYRVIDIEDTTYTLQAVFASTVYSILTADEVSKTQSKNQVTALYDAVMKTNEEFIQSDKLADEQHNLEEDGSDEGMQLTLFDLISKQKRSAYRDISLEGRVFTVLQEGFYYWAQVFRFKKGIIPLVFPWLNTKIAGDAVLKIYDAWRLEIYYREYGEDMGFYTYDEWKDYVVDIATTEIECYIRIQEYNDSSETNKIKSPELYDFGNMYITRDKDVKLGSVIHRGPYILMSNLEKTEDRVPISLIEEDGVRQLKLLHKLGIEHRDVYPKNYFTSKDGVHFFDFSLARIHPGKVPKEKADKEIEKFKAELHRKAGTTKE